MTRPFRQMFASFWLLAMSSACAKPPRPLSDLTALHTRTIPQSLTASQDSLGDQVNHYIKYLDGVRMQNAEVSLKERRKFDYMSILGISLGTGAAMFGFLSDDKGKKAKVAGVSGAAAAFLTALVAKFRHGEDAQHGATCAKQVERTLETFKYPQTTTQFAKARDSIASRLDELDCLAPYLR